MPLTQELIGDALGLSVPHVSRTLKQLREDDLVAIEGQRVIIKDIEALSRLADFERAYLSRFQLSELLGREAAMFGPTARGNASRSIRASPFRPRNQT